MNRILGLVLAWSSAWAFEASMLGGFGFVLTAVIVTFLDD